MPLIVTISAKSSSIASIRKHSGTALVARIWRGRGAEDPEQTVTAEEIKQYEIAVSENGKPLMCWRNDVAEEVSEYGFSVETSLVQAAQQRDRRRYLLSVL